MPAWLIFLLSAVAVILAGLRLAKDGDTIAAHTGLGGLWVGAIFVAAATSLPELTTDAYAVRQGNPNLAIGDLFGSSMANMMILAVADLATRTPRMLTRVAINQALLGTLAICLTIVAALGALASGGFTVLGMGWATITVGFVYVVGMRVIHRNRPERQSGAPHPEEAPPPAVAQRFRRAIGGFVAAAIVILVAAHYVASSAADLAEQLGISQGFLGLVLLAFTTSLPELVVSIASVRSGSYDLAVGNLLGSCCFNMVLLVPLDLVAGRTSLLTQADPALLIGALFAVLMMGLALIEILNKSERRVWALEPGPTFMVVAYFAGLYLTYRVGH